ncbi:hypothetical protein [Thomasclavelia cocleata]|uniref:hypothetical protein n=1 Tax=Thomasclavelia cocleata TaxID=69824 RepID=UPI00243039CA|nr:hypothetical protein [Thomasclavelia cocleata]
MANNVDKKDDDRIQITALGMIKALNQLAKGMEILLKQENSTQTYQNKKNIDTIRNNFKELIERLKKPTKNFNIKLFIDELDKYLISNKRLLYSEFTSIIIGLNSTENSDQNIGIIITNLENCISYSVEEDKNVSKSIQKTLIKLWDHANLASNQYNYFMTTDDAFLEKVKPILDSKITDLKNEYESLSDEVKNAKTELECATDNAKNIKNKITSDVIAMISMFVGIAFVMFGGMTLLNNLFDFSGMETIPLMELVCLGSLMGIIMIVIIYAFIIFVLKLTEKDIKNSQLINWVLIVFLSVLVFIFVITLSIWNNYFLI